MQTNCNISCASIFILNGDATENKHKLFNYLSYSQKYETMYQYKLPSMTGTELNPSKIEPPLGPFMHNIHVSLKLANQWVKPACTTPLKLRTEKCHHC